MTGATVVVGAGPGLVVAVAVGAVGVVCPGLVEGLVFAGVVWAGTVDDLGAVVGEVAGVDDVVVVVADLVVGG